MSESSKTFCTVVAIFSPLPEHRDEVRALLSRVTPQVQVETGCEFYTLNEDVDGRFIFIEAWTTRQNWVDHVEMPTVKEILGGVEGKLYREVEVYEMYNIPLGDVGKGSLAGR